MPSHITVTVTFRKKSYVDPEAYVAFVKEAVREWGYCVNGIATKGATEGPGGERVNGPFWGLGDKAKVALQKDV